jgi:hypothetical protein
MAELSYEDRGWDEFVTEIVAESEAAAKIAVFDAGNHLREAIVEKLKGQRTGKRYNVRGTGTKEPGRRRKNMVKYTASAPREPPAVMIGNLGKNINVTPVQVDGDAVFVQVGVDLEVVPYARRLEFGGAHTAKHGHTITIAPRPYMRPAFVEQEATLNRILERAAGSK